MQTQPWMPDPATWYGAVRLEDWYDPKGHLRPWFRTIVIRVYDGSLREGDFETGLFLEVPGSTCLDVVSGPPYRLVILAPSMVEPGQTFRVVVKTEDRWGNLCDRYDGTGELQGADGLPERHTFVPDDGGVRRWGGVVLAYEWSGTTPAGGDHNVYFLRDDQVIRRSSHRIRRPDPFELSVVRCPFSIGKSAFICVHLRLPVPTCRGPARLPAAG